MVRSARRDRSADVRTSEDVVVSAVGRDLYEKFFQGYTRKQWGMDPSELDKSVTARVSPPALAATTGISPTSIRSCRSTVTRGCSRRCWRSFQHFGFDCKPIIALSATSSPIVAADLHWPDR